MKQKLAMIADARSTTIYAASEKYNVDRKRIREWMGQKDQLSRENSGAYRLSGGGRKLRCDELDELLISRVRSKRHEKERVTRSMISEWGLEVAREFGVDLDCTRGWVDKFMARHELTLRKATNKPVLEDSVIAERAAAFVIHVKALIETHGILQENIFCLDETALFYDHDKDTTVEAKGAKHVQVKK